MNIVCVICSDLLIPSDDVFHTPCGHLFHFHCLNQWLERSKSCPQCREKTTTQKIHRIYFNFSNNDTIVEDTCSLQDKIDKLNFQLVLKEKDIKHYTGKSETLETQNKGLKKEVRKVESELNEKNSAIYALKEQIKYFKLQYAETESKDKEIEQLQKKLENCKNVQSLLEGSTEDVDDMITKTSDPNTLITYISVMKREMTVSLNKRRELRTKVKSLQQELTKVSMERNFLSEEHTRRKKLEEDLLICESEKMVLQNRVTQLEKYISSRKKSIDCDMKIAEEPSSNSSNVSKQDKIKNILNIAKLEDGEDQQGGQSTATGLSDSPYLPVKSTGVFVLKPHVAEKSCPMKLGGSILSKKPRVDPYNIGRLREKMGSNAISYDGFGGRSKFDEFPTPIGLHVKRTKDDTSKPKKPKLDVEDNQKLSNFLVNFM